MPTEEEPNLAWAYLRVSTTKQETDNQRIQMEVFCKNRNYWIPEDRWYIEDGVTGKIPALERPVFKRLHDDLIEMASRNQEGVPKNVLMYEVSRIGRTFWETLEAIKFLEDLSPLMSTSPKETFIQVQDKSMRNLMLSILAFFAEREREVLVQRTIEGVNRAHLEGKHSGQIPNGYEQHVCEKLSHNKCPLSGKLFLNLAGKQVHNLLQLNPKLKAVQVQKHLGNDYKEAWNLLKSVKKFGQPESTPASSSSLSA